MIESFRQAWATEREDPIKNKPTTIKKNIAINLIFKHTQLNFLKCHKALEIHDSNLASDASKHS